MDIVLLGLNWVSTLVYINDIIIFSVSFNNHLQHLQEVFNQLHSTNMFMKPSKCNFCQTELPFLGHLMRKDSITTDPKKVHIVREMAQPVHTTKVQAFLRLCNYYWQFIPVFMEVTCTPMRQSWPSEQSCPNRPRRVTNRWWCMPVSGCPSLNTTTV
jgi:hypothetical protein